MRWELAGYSRKTPVTSQLPREPLPWVLRRLPHRVFVAEVFFCHGFREEDLIRGVECGGGVAFYQLDVEHAEHGGVGEVAFLSR